MALVPFLTRTPGLIDTNRQAVLFATKLSKHATDNHTHETLKPLASELRVKINKPYAASEYQALAHDILTGAAFKDKLVVICWTHTYLPALVNALGVSSGPAAWDKDLYDRVLVITYADGKARMVNLPQRLLLGDSPD